MAIFGGDTPLGDLNAFLRSLDQDPIRPLVDNRGVHRDIDLKIGLIDALKDLRNRFNCLLVVPHPDQAKGLKSLTAETAARFLLEIRPDAVEDCPGEEKERLRSTGGLPANFWNQVAFVEFSNPKRIEEMGTQCRTDGTLRSTYVKLSATGIDALRSALRDPETRLSIGGVPSAIYPRDPKPGNLRVGLPRKSEYFLEPRPQCDDRRQGSWKICRSRKPPVCPCHHAVHGSVLPRGACSSCVGGWRQGRGHRR